VIGANRTYYQTRSQPPFLSSTVLAVYEAETKAGHDGLAWLKTAYPYLEKEYAIWRREPHRAGSTGLARYYDFADGPAGEKLQDESGYFRKVVSYFSVHPEAGIGNLLEEKIPTGSGFTFAVTACDVGKDATDKTTPECEAKRLVRLSDDYLK